MSPCYRPGSSQARLRVLGCTVVELFTHVCRAGAKEERTLTLLTWNVATLHKLLNGEKLGQGKVCAGRPACSAHQPGRAGC